MRVSGAEAIRVFESTIESSPPSVRADLSRAVHWARECYQAGLVEPEARTDAKQPTLNLRLPGEKREFVTIWNDGASPQIALNGPLITARLPDDLAARARDLVSGKPFGLTVASHDFGDATFELLTSLYRAASLASLIRPGGVAAPSAPTVKDVPIEEQYTIWVAVRSQAAVRQSTRAEHQLVLRYRSFLEDLGDQVVAKDIAIPGEGRIRNDVYNISRDQLVEAKASIERPSVRMGIWQLFDYRRFLEPQPALGLLLPGRPCNSIGALLSSLEITAIWANGEGFEDSAGGSFT